MPDSNEMPRSRRRLPAFFRRHPLAAAVLVLLVYVAALRLWWGNHLTGKLENQRAAARQRGEPMTWSELSWVPLPDAENAWIIQAQAAAADDGTSPGNSLNEDFEFPPFGLQWEQAARSSEETNAKVFQLARQARIIDKAQFSKAYPSGAWNLAHIRTMGQLANTLADSALFQQLVANDAESVDRLLDVLHVAHSLRCDDSTFGQMHALFIDGIACKDARIIGPGLRIGLPGVRDRVRILIAVLQDEQPATQGLHHAMLLERICANDIAHFYSATTLLIRPLGNRNAVAGNADRALEIEAAGADNAEDARRILAGKIVEPRDASSAAILKGRMSPVRYSRWYRSTFSDQSQSIEALFRVLGDRRTAAISLAMQLYRADRGHWPGDLKELTPEYLKAIPADPFHADHRPIGYTVLKAAMPDGADRPLLFFDAGETADVIISPNPMYGWQNDPREGQYLRKIRQYRDVARWIPQAAP